MEDKNKQVNLPPAEGEQEENRKKPLAGGLFGRGSVLRGSWGEMLAKFTASKTAVVAVGLGVTALAGLATMTVSSNKSAVGGGSGEMLAFSPYERYTPGAGGGGDSAVFPLPYAEGNGAYKDELYSASVSPNAAQSEAASEYSSADAAAAAAEALPTAASGASGLKAGGAPGGGGGGGGSSMVSSGGKNAAAAAKAAAAGAAGVAKLANAAAGANRSGAAVSKQGSARGSRLATGGMDSMKNKSGVGVPLVGSAELAKAKSDVKFGETPVAGSGSALLGDPDGAAEQSTDTASDAFEMPTAPSDTSSSAGGGGGGGGSSEAEAAMAEKLKELTKESSDLLQQLLDLATAEDRGKLCSTDGTFAAIVELISEKSNELIEHLDKMGDAQALTAAKVANWKCNIAMQMVDVVSTFAKDSVVDYCTIYLTRKTAEETKQRMCGESYGISTTCDYWTSKAAEANAAWEAAQPAYTESVEPVQTFKTKLDTEIGLKTLLMMGQTGILGTGTGTGTGTDTGAAADTCPFEVQS